MTEERTHREELLDYADDAGRTKARAIRALVSIHQTHLSYYHYHEP